jgi:hypothetical protein
MQKELKEVKLSRFAGDNLSSGKHIHHYEFTVVWPALQQLWPMLNC